MKKPFSERLEVVALCIKGFTGVVGASLILENEHPYMTLLVCGVGAVANELIIYVQRKANENK